MSNYTPEQNATWFMGFGNLSPEDAKVTVDIIQNNIHIVSAVIEQINDFGWDDDEIVKSTGLPLAAVQKIRKDKGNK
jgi:hypothetical protein